MRKTMLAIATAVVLIPTMVMADGYHGDLGRSGGGVNFNGPVSVTSVATLKGTKIGERYAVIEGHILRQIGGDKFLFSDGTGEMVVELDDDIRLSRNIDSTTKLRMSGEFEAWSNEMEVEWAEII